MLLVDRVLEITPEEVVAEKLVSVSEPALTGHFPGQPIFPGVLLIEAMGQAAGVWALVNHPEHRDRGIALLGVDKARFRRPVVPGDVVRLHAKLVRRRGDVYRFTTSAFVGSDLSAEAEIIAAFLDREGAP
jgi:3-hydroxyacyl-[acyl-carrier-protein] dehydratase